jgi:hypothetical protein
MRFRLVVVMICTLVISGCKKETCITCIVTQTQTGDKDTLHYCDKNLESRDNYEARNTDAIHKARCY